MRLPSIRSCARNRFEANDRNDTLKVTKMTQQQIALMELTIMMGLGAALVLTALLIRVRSLGKTKRCTSKATGKVVDHSFMGDGRIAPIVEYEVNGVTYRCKKKFNGILKFHSTTLNKPEAWEDEKGYLHVRTGVIANVRQLAQQLWPLGFPMDVHYDPSDPSVSYVGMPINNSALSLSFIAAGAATAAFGILIHFLMLHA